MTYTELHAKSQTDGHKTQIRATEIRGGIDMNENKMEITVAAGWLKAIRGFCSVDASRCVLAGIHCEIVSGGVFIVATDGWRLAAMRIGNADGAGGFTIPARAIDAALLGVPSKSIVCIEWDGGKAINLGTGLYKISATAIDGKFPKWRDVIPKGEPEPVAEFSLFLIQLQSFQSAAKSIGDGYVNFITRGDGPIEVLMPKVPDFYGIVMPSRLTPATKPKWITESVETLATQNANTLMAATEKAMQ